MAWVYILKGSSGRHYLLGRLLIYRKGSLKIGAVIPHTTKRIGNHLDVAASKEVATLKESRNMETTLKAKKNPHLAIYHLQR